MTCVCVACEDLKAAAEKYGLHVKNCGYGKFQIIGLQRVNYWPHSARRMAYVVGSKKGRRNTTPEHACQLAVGDDKEWM